MEPQGADRAFDERVVEPGGQLVERRDEMQGRLRAREERKEVSARRLSRRLERTVSKKLKKACTISGF